jgi:hypothetical protein
MPTKKLGMKNNSDVKIKIVGTGDKPNEMIGPDRVLRSTRLIAAKMPARSKLSATARRACPGGFSASHPPTQ